MKERIKDAAFDKPQPQSKRSFAGRSIVVAFVLLLVTVSVLAAVFSKANTDKSENLAGNELYCTLSIDCSVLLDNMSQLKTEKQSLVPKDGIMLCTENIPFSDGDSVFDILLRNARQNRLHMEFETAPIYGSAYIEGIGNIYEFDCGENSGWMYRVNGEIPQVGCSSYYPKNGDRIEWFYTIGLGTFMGTDSGT